LHKVSADTRVLADASMASSSSAEKSKQPMHAGPRRRSVVFAVAIFGAITIALLPIADRPGPAMPGIVAVFATGFLITELSTSFLLLVRFRAVPKWSLLALACAYFYSGLMTLPHLLTFTGAVLAERPLVDASPVILATDGSMRTPESRLSSTQLIGVNGLHAISRQPLQNDPSTQRFHHPSGQGHAGFRLRAARRPAVF
jgi:hypothetical protein